MRMGYHPSHYYNPMQRGGRYVLSSHQVKVSNFFTLLSLLTISKRDIAIALKSIVALSWNVHGCL